MDTKPLEEQAESYIKSQLLKFQFKVIKPIFDESGSDLIIIDNHESKFWNYINIQSKGRTLSTKNTNVSIPTSYVNNQFILFIYTIDLNLNEYLFIFFENDIKHWNVNDNKFIISFNENKIKGKYFQDRIFNKNHYPIIIEQLKNSKTLDIFDEISTLKNNFSELKESIIQDKKNLGIMDTKEMIRIHLDQNMKPHSLIKMMKENHNTFPLLTFLRISEYYKENNIDETELWLNRDNLLPKE